MSHFRVRVQSGVIEIEVDSSEKDYTEAKMKELLATFLPVGGGHEPRTASATKQTDGHGKRQSLAECVRALNPRSGPEYVVAVGHYLETQGGKPNGFRSRDVAEGCRMVKFKVANPRDAVLQARRQGFVMDGTDPGTVVLSRSGEEWVKSRQADGAQSK